MVNNTSLNLMGNFVTVFQGAMGKTLLRKLPECQ